MKFVRVSITFDIYLEFKNFIFVVNRQTSFLDGNIGLGWVKKAGNDYH